MDVIITKKYSLRNQPFYSLVGTVIALVDSDTQSLSFYSQKLKQANMDVSGFESLSQLADHVTNSPVDVVIFSPSLERLSSEMQVLASFVSKNPQLPLLTMAKTMQEKEIDAIMKLGARMHINRDLSQPRDLLVALEQILLK
ncbi:hypothetical protein IPM19_04200 [bacterium]|nr:MAG: hypothetical protein IPM19_04200 [bacterium]